MRIGITVYDHLDVASGGYLYDRKLVKILRERDHTVVELHQRGGCYGDRLLQNMNNEYVDRVVEAKLDVLVQDELNHASLLRPNRRLRRIVRHPILGIVHHLMSVERRCPTLNRLIAGVEKAYLSTLDGYICNSRTTHRTVERLIGPNLPYVVAPPAADRVAPSLSPDEVSDRVRRKRPLRLLFIGNLIERKGLDVLLKALTRLFGEVPFHLDIVGGSEADPTYAEAMEVLVDRLGLSGVVTFHGHTVGERLRELYRQADVLTVPSSYEGFGIVYLEGMAFGLPAIASLHGGAKEVVTHAENGFLVPYGASDRITGFLRTFAQRGELLERFSRAALRRYERHPAWSVTMARAADFIERTASVQV
ncbi:glycosyltransferase [bacterium]|nr:glycosyltransferase [bacterium]